MHVTRSQIIQRGFTHRCPNCGGRTLFRAGTMFKVNRACTACGLPIERDEGSFLGSMALNYGVTVLVYLLPLVVLGATGVLSAKVALIAGLVGAFVFPALFYRSSRSWWIMCYYFFLPQHLPANRRAVRADEDENI
ncbi:DUF983 domain-containing protein [Horticoccus luteus]|uniref:DUF983 domain-containing protein n=1 Tax=Horticoccus luteus TaxID=2862869 RepID=A0A8F9TVM2_9BACT|nr:DUF983 domain-containing protein [Horticoccus luteus]QYM80084.1 DUF983 domain-containing protein [Horticoccus luteus]